MNKLAPISFVLGLSAAITVAVNSDQNVKFYGTLLTGVGIGGFVLSQVDSKDSKEQIENLQKTVEVLDKERRKADDSRKSAERLLSKDTHQIKEKYENDMVILAGEVQRYQKDNADLANQITQLKSEIKLTKKDSESALRGISSFSTSSGYEIALNTYDVQFKKLEGIIPGYKRNYPALSEFFENLECEIDEVKSRSIAELESYEGVKTLQVLIDEGLRIQERIISRCSDIKLKALINIIRYLEDLAKDSIGFDIYQQHIQDMAEKAKLVILDKENETTNVAQQWIESNTQTQQRYESEFNETLETGKHLVKRNQELVAKIESMNRPLQWSRATRQDLQIGNIIIGFYEARGIILDRAECDYDHWQSTLRFHIDRNDRIIVASELEPDGEKLQQLTHTLSPIKFGWDSDRGMLTAWLHLAKKPTKAIAESDISKIWKSADKFPTLVKNWSRVRLTGGSESGKSPTAENLAVCILRSSGGTAKLFNPQTDSVKNYWSVPSVGTSHADSVAGIEALASQVNQKTSDRSKFQLTIFDEIDSTMVSVEKKEQGVIGQNISTIIKQVSHQNLGVIFIGQNANASKYPGMDRSDWNSAINVHIGSNAYDAITNTNQIGKPDQDRLKAQADLLTEFCNNKNVELGLEKTNQQAYRFALVLGDGKPYFIQLPDFGSYTYDSVENALTCPHCGSKNHISKGDNRRECKDCRKSFSV